MTPPPNRGQRPNPDLTDEVEAFLRSVQQRQGQQRQGQQQDRRPQRSAKSQPVTAEIVEAQVVSPLSVTEGGGGLSRGAVLSSESVAQEAERVAQQAQSLGADIDQNDERVAEQIHSKFDHQLGQFDASQATSDDATQVAAAPDPGGTDIAADLRRMLADPRDIRRAIVLSEILNPPVDRW